MQITKMNELKKIIENITSGLDKCSLPQNAILYRGIGTNAIENLLSKDVKNIMDMGLKKELSEEQINTFCNILKGKHFTEKAFTSTSYDKKSAFQKPVFLNIFAKKGCKCGLIEELSIKPQEKEALIQKNANFEIRKVEFKDNKWTLDVDIL